MSDGSLVGGRAVVEVSLEEVAAVVDVGDELVGEVVGDELPVGGVVVCGTEVTGGVAATVPAG